jgi:hypothetical protein
MDNILTSSLVNAAIGHAAACALKDVLLETKEQKDLYNEKFKFYLKKIIHEFSPDFGLEQAEEISKNILQGIDS